MLSDSDCVCARQPVVAPFLSGRRVPPLGVGRRAGHHNLCIAGSSVQFLLLLFALVLFARGVCLWVSGRCECLSGFRRSLVASLFWRPRAACLSVVLVCESCFVTYVRVRYYQFVLILSGFSVLALVRGVLCFNVSVISPLAYGSPFGGRRGVP